MNTVSEALEFAERSLPSDLATTAGHIVRIEAAAALMSFAYAEKGLPAPKTKALGGPASHSTARKRRAKHETLWSVRILASSLNRLAEVTVALRRPLPAVYDAQLRAFDLLVDLTAFKDRLRTLRDNDPALAFRELARQLGAYERQLAASAAVFPLLTRTRSGVASLAADRTGDAPDNAADAFEAARDRLIEQAGGVMPLTEAAKALGVTRQALHKRVYGNGALGMMLGGRIAVPRVQLADKDGKTVVLEGIDKVARAFAEAEAGAWAALQFLVEPNPNLNGARPVDALREGRIKEVEQAARAYLGLDEG